MKHENMSYDNCYKYNFKGCRRLREIAVPPGVTHVGEYAFHRCHSLKSVSMLPG
ncbi:MAG TPA: hypothetical protein DCZ91_06065 [Lachnospiraceae bacterium]|nr:hypothetical protein [Lachnospiraceae bacterium]